MKRTKDPKDLLLLALYAEFNKPCGNYRQVTAKLLDMEPDVWLWSLMCLKTEGLVEGVKWIPPGAASPEEVLALHADRMRLTPAGVEYAKELAGTDGRNRLEVLRRLVELFADVGKQLLAEELRRFI